MTFAKGLSKIKKLTLEQQYNSIKNCPFSSNGKGSFMRDYFYWEFIAQPTPLSKTYLVLLIFHIDNRSPDVFILDQNVWDISKKKSIPHLYDPENIKLCLYYPKYKDWDQTMPLNTTFVPWIYLWLYYYEEWLFSNEWKGGGEHSKSLKEEENENIKNTPKQLIIEQRKKKKQDSIKNIINKIYLNRKNIYLNSSC